MSDTARKPAHRESTELLAMGAGVAAMGAITAIVGAAACPLCVVTAPTLVGIGLYKRWRERATEPRPR